MSWVAYHAVGSVVTLAAIYRTGEGKLQVYNIVKADLFSRRERVKHALRMVKLCSILPRLQQRIGEGRDTDMFTHFRPDGSTIEFGETYVRKSYTQDREDGIDPIRHLEAVYELLVSKKVPNVDYLDKVVPVHPRGPYVQLKPIGLNNGPQTALDIRNAVVCILEALKVAYAHPPVFHRDIRWPNVIQSRQDLSKWFLIDWEDAASPPTKAAHHLNKVEHSQRVFEDGHGAEVDIWSVGRLLNAAPVQMRHPALTQLGQKLMQGLLVNAEQALKEILTIQV
ncbi:hypothetical protein BDN72DRAFT_960918 [Pluteus cervinus]|uniref:Uncharacterized protein n=1 Tax=Pluteus cervinus TaxID=181527 RepID=A0ACD3APN5_9AGAR|nr:hypothetical protein BDN72DRAFT_960918 [Pluteus cervinus]